MISLSILSQVRDLIAPNYGRGEETIAIFNRDLCREEPDLPDSYHSMIPHSPDPNGVVRKTSVIRAYSPSACMVGYYLLPLKVLHFHLLSFQKILISNRVKMLVWDHVEDNMLRTVRVIF